MPEISILIVEDEAITLESLVVTLAKKYPKATIHKALNGRIGLELFKEHSPNIVITDLNMPEFSGVQLAEKIHKLKPETKFIVLTGYTGKRELEDSVGNGLVIDHYIVKPVFFHDLFAAVEQCIESINRLNNR